MVASTTVKITNDTKETAYFAASHNYHGDIQGKYPAEIGSGQTIEFVFASEDGESSGLVVYRGRNDKGKEFDWMYAWSNVDGAPEATYKAYTEIDPAHYYDTVPDWLWDYVREHFILGSDNFTLVEWNRSVTESKISNTQGVVLYEGKMDLTGRDKLRART